MNPDIPNAGKYWIREACKLMSDLVDEDKPEWKMRIYPGDDHSKSDDTPLDDLLLDEGVVNLIKTNHPKLISTNKLFEDKDTLHMFFGTKRDADLIRTLFD